MSQRTGNTHYETLAVSENASPETITAAYRRLAQRHHPDKRRGDPDAEERFKRIQVAYLVLKDPAKRATYDAALTADRARAEAAREAARAAARAAERAGAVRREQEARDLERPAGRSPENSTVGPQKTTKAGSHFFGTLGLLVTVFAQLYFNFSHESRETIPVPSITISPQASPAAPPGLQAEVLRGTDAPTRIELEAYRNRLREYERRFPQLNPDSPSYDRLTVDKTAERVKLHTLSGKGPVAALDAAMQDQFLPKKQSPPQATRPAALMNREGMSNGEVIQRLIDDRRGMGGR